ncbi:hypothetical protein [Collinsella vaginalis]|uniref:hypothetical protein n=1 Tax=Collinsella vaginalis TaxID=1870987 RepID=UPI000A26C68C|nr:hypothetical protein [Collinsella vaginalis]
MSDEFFDDEQELMEAAAGREEPPAEQAAARGRRRGKGEGPSADAPKAAPEPSDRPVRQAPPFWMVLAIAAIALILGIVIGYLLGTSATLAELSQGAQTATSTTSSTQLPEGHPELNVNEDGTASVAGSGSSAQ